MQPDERYVLMTPARDEVDLLHDLVVTIRAQEQRPALWLVVDDGSADGTADALDDLSRREPWIHTMHLPRGTNGSALRYAEVLALGFRTLAELAEAEGVDYRYVANIDADVRCPPSLLAEVITRMDGDRMIGIASCLLAEVRDDGELVPELDLDCGAPRGGVRVWRRECLDQIAYYPTPHWAGVTGLRARNRGWKTATFDDLVAEVVRGDGTRQGWWAGYHRLGNASWEVGMHPALLAWQALRASVHDRDLRGLAMLAGFVQGVVRKPRRPVDPELRDYFGSDLPKQRLGALIRRIRRR